MALIRSSAVVLIVAVAAGWWTSSADDATPSTYAPAADLLHQMESYLDSIERDLSDREEFGEDQELRIRKDANTLAVIAQVLSQHDQENPFQDSGSNLMAAALALADAAGDYDEAVAAYEGLRESVDTAGEGEAVDWEPAADLVELMKQVPIVNTSLNRGVGSTPRRFSRAQDRNAALAATLAAIAEASFHDTAYCGDEEEEALWMGVCADMREASADVLRAIRADDQAAAQAGLDRITATCDACHDYFR